MPQPLDGRVPFAVPVQVVGVTPSGTAFCETAYTIDVSRYGVRLDKVNFLRRPGDHVTLRYGERSARYRVAWVGTPNTPQAGQAGLAILEGETFLWGTQSAVAEDHAPAQPVRNAVELAGPRSAHRAQPATTQSAAAPAIAQTRTTIPRRPETPNGSIPAVPQQDRRTSRRYQCDRAALCWKDGERTPRWGKLRDLSLGGCFVETSMPFETNAVASVMLMLYGHKIRARAQVRVHQPGQGMGLHFLAMQPEEMHKLKLVLERLAEPDSERHGMMNNEGSVLKQLRHWFEQNDTLQREQFYSLLGVLKSRE